MFFFKKDKTLKPKVNKGLFYFSSGWDFEDAVFRLLDANHKDEPYIGELCPVLKSLRLFSRIAGQISNGGFSQLYYNGYADTVRDCIPGLFEIGETKVAEMLSFSYSHHILSGGEDNLNIEFNKLSETAQIEQIKNFLHHSFSRFDKRMASKYNLFGMEWAWDTLHSEFYDIQFQTQQNIVKYIKNNPRRFVVDENGKPINTQFTGIYKNTNDTINYEISMKQGKPHGYFKIYRENSDEISKEGEFEHGFLKHYYYYFYSYKDNSTTKFYYEFECHNNVVYEIKTTYYKNSEQREKQSRTIQGALSTKAVGEQKKWYKNGVPKKIENYEADDLVYFETFYANGKKDTKGLQKRFDILHCTYWHENGQKRREEFLDENNLNQEKWWHEDGSLAGYIAYDDTGNYLEHRCFYKNGKQSATYIDRKYKGISFQNCWDEKGNPTLINGTGTVRRDKIKDYKYDAKQLVFYEANYENGVKHGLTIRVDREGKRYEALYDSGKHVSSKTFDKEGNFIKK